MVLSSEFGAMTPLIVTNYCGKPIRCFADWAEFALPPERMRRHWKKGRSAFELGREWVPGTSPEVPESLMRLLDSHEATRGIRFHAGKTECETPLPFSTRGPRCHDLALYGSRAGYSVTVCIEAKADESFGETVANELKSAMKRPGSAFPLRFDWLCRSLLGCAGFVNFSELVLSSAVAHLRYQLFSAVAGTLLEAANQRSRLAVFVVHEFRTSATDDRKLAENAAALHDFVAALLAHNSCDSANVVSEDRSLIGPITMCPQGIPSTVPVPTDIPLFIGKIRTDRTQKRL